MYKLVDYWNNGNIDVMVGEDLIAEVEPVKNGFMLHFSVKVKQPDIKKLEQWVDSNIDTMIRLNRAADL
jgi:hypothetical protein